VRRKDREITEFDEIKQILTSGVVCRLALSIDDVPYIVPMNYGVEFSDPMVLYFHCAITGRKIEMIKKNNRVCFEIEIDAEVVEGKQACDWSMNYKSVIGYGMVEIIRENEQKIHGLNVLMEHYAKKEDFFYDHKVVERMLILKLTVESFSGKRHPA
jgi:nitroimidazol reductase NimA-like FMN-containing flavoprotein (pyridoxamine 5'-phosphate oxidase superfamily)